MTEIQIRLKELYGMCEKSFSSHGRNLVKKAKEQKRWPVTHTTIQTEGTGHKNPAPDECT